jgi:hypothetical protein
MPDVAELLAGNDSRSTQLAACRLAIEAARLDDDRATRALEGLTLVGPSRPQAEASRQLADEFDAAAWDAQEQGLDAEYDRLFRSARAAAALAFAHSDQASETLYEAAHAFEYPDQFTSALRAALST